MNVSFSQIKNTMVSAAQQAKEVYNKPEFIFQVSTGLLAACHLASKNAPQVFGKVISAKLLNTLDSINFFSIYGLLSIPRKLFFPVNSDTINKEKLLQIVSEKTKYSVVDDIIEQKLNTMEGTKEAYSNVTAFRNSLKAFVDRKIRVAFPDSQLERIENNKYYFINQSNNFKKFSVNLNFIDTIEIPLGTPNKKLVNLGFGLVDIQLFLLAFREWKIIDTAKWASNIAQYKGLKFIQTTSLDLVVRITLVATFAIKCHEAWYQLSSSFNLKKQIQEKNQELIVLNQAHIDLDLITLRQNSLKLLNPIPDQEGDSFDVQQESINPVTYLKDLENLRAVNNEKEEQINQQKAIKFGNILKQTEEKETELAELQKELKQMQWNLVTSAADLTSNIIGLLNHVKYINAPFNLMYGATLIARTLNAVRIIKGF
jgi:hypothetical protein